MPANADVATVGGLLSELLGRIPEAGDSVEWRGHRLTVMSAGHRGADLVEVRKID
jgi:putative hemolysin